MAKNDNLLAILWILNSGAKVTAKHIAEKLEINVRTVYRYIDSLCASGVPIISDAGKNGGYSLLRQFTQAPLFFSPDEQKSLLHAATIAKEAGYPFSADLNKAAQKLKIYSAPGQENVLNRHISGLEVINRAVAPSVKRTLEELEIAAATGYSVEIDYRASRQDQARTRTIDPYGILYWYNKWYTIGFCHLRNEIRSFRVERILRLQQTQNAFKQPEAFSIREFFLKDIIPDHETTDGLVSVMITGRAEALDDLSNHWYLSRHVKERNSNEAVFLLDEKAVYSYLPTILLSYGKAIQVIEPQSLKKMLASVARELAEYYQI